MHSNTSKINIIGCGYIGKKIARSLIKKQLIADCFVSSDDSKLSCEYLSLSCQKLNLDDPDFYLNDKIKIDIADSKIAYLVPPPRKGHADSRMSHFINMLNGLEYQPEKILLISTTGIYGNCDGAWIDESQLENPQADRAFRRLSAEQQLQSYCESKNTELIIFRVPGIYSKDKIPVNRIISGEPVVCAADSGFTNRIHADDLAAFCVEALTSIINSGIYNCCDGYPTTMNDYFMKVADAMHLPRPAEISLQQAQQELSSGMLSYLAESKRISNKKLLNNFKTEFKYPNLEKGLKNI